MVKAEVCVMLGVSDLPRLLVGVFWSTIIQPISLVTSECPDTSLHSVVCSPHCVVSANILIAKFHLSRYIRVGVHEEVDAEAKESESRSSSCSSCPRSSVQ